MLTCLLLIFLTLVRILRTCPWYEELEPVMRDCPMARPMWHQDTIGLRGQDIDHSQAQLLGLTNEVDSHNNSNKDFAANDASTSLLLGQDDQESFG